MQARVVKHDLASEDSTLVNLSSIDMITSGLFGCFVRVLDVLRTSPGLIQRVCA